MFLKRIELNGFKSFADKTNLEFLSDITTVIGPNGSGKSNVVDAFRWVLGEQSMKSLRGHKAEDIIFAGTQARKPVGFAEVNLVVDNSSGVLPIEYEEVVITRRLYRSGESEYLINKTACRLKDIQQLFLNTGVGKEGYSIIGQGKVEEILNSKSEDRRYMFEEAAGILKYRYRKNEAERKLESTKNNLVRVNDIINEIDGRLESLCVQSEKAKKYLNYRDELKQKEIGLFNYTMDKNNASLNEVNEKIDIETMQVNNQEQELNNIQQDKIDTKAKIEELNMKQETIQNFKYESDSLIEKYNSEIVMLNMQKKNNEENFELLDKEIEELTVLIEKNKEEINSKNSKKEVLLANKVKFEEELNKKQAQYDEIYSKLSEKGEEVEAKKDRIQTIHEEKMNIKMEINTLNNESINNENIYLKLEKEYKEKIHLKDSKKIECEDYEVELNKLLSEKKKIDNVIIEYNNKKNEIDNKTKEYDNNIEQLNSELKNKKARHAFLVDIQKEREGYARAVKEILISTQKDCDFSKGVEGSVADIINTPKKYEVAIEMALGGYLQNIVTLTEESAKKCIEFLKDNNYGRASFLPISAITGKKADKIKDIQKEIGYIGVASDLVEYNKKYEQIILNLLGKTIIVETIEDGIRISKIIGKMYKIVTLQGDIIATSGQMTGGSIHKKSSSILGRTQEIDELEKDIKELSIQIDKMIKDKEEYLNNIDIGNIDIIKINEELNEINICIATTNQKVEMLKNEILSITDRNNKVLQEQETIKNRKQDIIELIEEKEKKIEQMDNILEQLKVEVEEYTSLFKDEQKYIDDLKDEIVDLKISINSFDESNMSFEEVMNMLNQDIEKASINISKKQEQKIKIKEENLNFDERIININLLIEESNTKKDNIENDIKQIKEEKEKQNKYIDDLDAKLEQALKDISLLKNDLTKLENKRNKIEDDIEELKIKMIEEYEISLEQLLEQRIEIEEPNKVQKEINFLKKNIKELGSVNVDSIEEYRESKERFDFLSKQRNDLEITENKLKKLINEITIVMKEQFKTKFKIINENFGQVFEKLFGGGKAEIRLTDENDILNCGVEIEAQPPGKKLQNIMLLSGGEKTLTAIALLFGILTTNPSPFCILDEIEAALDDINIFRFAQFVKEYSKNTQFLMITHRKGTMEIADSLYGVTMQEQGISKLISMKV